jgi:predicted nucleic acid-binding protein
MGSKKVVLCDTNILIEYLRGSTTMLAELDAIGFDRLAINAIVKAEILAGMNKGQVRRTREVLNKFDFYDVDKETSRLFIRLVNGFYDRRPGLPDMLIAATALVNNTELLTLNRADFSFIPGLRLYNPHYQHNVRAN